MIYHSYLGMFVLNYFKIYKDIFIFEVAEKT